MKQQHIIFATTVGVLLIGVAIAQRVDSITTGGVGSLSQLPQDGASAGQALVWDGAKWGPDTVSGSGDVVSTAENVFSGAVNTFSNITASAGVFTNGLQVTGPISADTLIYNGNLNVDATNGGAVYLKNNGGTSLYTSIGSVGVNRNLIFVTDNSYDIGASGASRPKSIYVSDTVNAVKTAYAGGEVIQSVGGGLRVQVGSPGLYIYNEAARFGLGGITAAYPALKRNGTQLEVRLADDSGETSFRGGGVTLINSGWPSVNGSGNNLYLNSSMWGLSANGEFRGKDTGKIGFVASGISVSQNGDTYISRGDIGTLLVDTNLIAKGTITGTNGFLAGDGTVGAPAYSWLNDADSGWVSYGSGNAAWVDDGSMGAGLISQGITLPSVGALRFSPSGSVLSSDTSIERVDVGTVRVNTNLIARGTITATNGLLSFGTSMLSVYGTNNNNILGNNAMVVASSNSEVLNGTFGVSHSFMAATVNSTNHGAGENSIIGGSGHYIGPTNEIVTDNSISGGNNNKLISANYSTIVGSDNFGTNINRSTMIGMEHALTNATDAIVVGKQIKDPPSYALTVGYGTNRLIMDSTNGTRFLGDVKFTNNVSIPEGTFSLSKSDISGGPLLMLSSGSFGSTPAITYTNMFGVSVFTVDEGGAIDCGGLTTIGTVQAGSIRIDTNGTPPADTVNIKGWINVTVNGGQVFKMPIYK